MPCDSVVARRGMSLNRDLHYYCFDSTHDSKCSLVPLKACVASLLPYAYKKRINGAMSTTNKTKTARDRLLVVREFPHILSERKRREQNTNGHDGQHTHASPQSMHMYTPLYWISLSSWKNGNSKSFSLAISQTTRPLLCTRYLRCAAVVHERWRHHTAKSTEKI